MNKNLRYSVRYTPTMCPEHTAAREEWVEVHTETLLEALAEAPSLEVALEAIAAYQAHLRGCHCSPAPSLASLGPAA